MVLRAGDWMIVDFAIGEEGLQGDRPVAYISSGVAAELTAKGDILYISDSRATWGLRSTHAIVGGINENLQASQIQITPTLNEIAGRKGFPLRIKRMY